MDAAGKRVLKAATDGSIADFDAAVAALPKDTAVQDVKNESGSNALHLACEHNHADLAVHMVESCSFDATTHLDGQGRSASGVAVVSNSTSVLKSLLDMKNSPISDSQQKGKLLIQACGSGQPDAVAILLEHGADPNSTSEDGMPAVFFTAAMAALKVKIPGREEEAKRGIACMEQLLKAGGNANAAAPGGFTPLHVAAEAGSAEMVSALLAAGADADAQTTTGQTPAAVAVSWGHRAVAETLLRASAGDSRSVEELFRESEEKEAAQKQVEASKRVPVPEDPDKGKAEVLKREGNVAFVAGDFEAALKAYKEALRHATDSAAVWANAAAASLRLKQWEDALRDARIARVVDPKYVKAWYREGQAAEGLKMWEDAAAAYFEAHLLQPGGQGEMDFAEMVKSCVAEAKRAHAENAAAAEETQ